MKNRTKVVDADSAIAQARALLRGDYSKNENTSEIIRRVWIGAFDLSFSEKERSECMNTVKGVFESLSRKDPIAELPKWHGIDYRQEELDAIRAQMDKVKHHIHKETLIVPIMVSGFIYGAYAYKLARKKFPEARFMLAGYTNVMMHHRPDVTKETTLLVEAPDRSKDTIATIVRFGNYSMRQKVPEWYANRLWIAETDKQLARRTKDAIVVDDLIATGQTMSAVEYGIAALLGKNGMKRVKPFAPDIA